MSFSDSVAHDSRFSFSRTREQLESVDMVISSTDVYT